MTKEIKNKLIETGKRLYAKGCSPGYSGNISVKNKNNIIISASGTNLGHLEEKDLVTIDLNGNAIDGKASSERYMHTKIYAKRPDVKAIVHCHAPKSSAFAVAGMPLTAPILAENVFTLGPVPIVEYGLPSTDELAEKVSDAFLGHEAVLMANHGVTVVGKTIDEAYFKLETLEYYAEVYLWSKVLGKSVELPKNEVQKILQLRQNH